MVSNSFSILFFTRKKRNNSNDSVSIYLRITVDSKRTELSIQRKIKPTDWNSAGKVNGTSHEALEINKHLDEIRHRIYTIHSKLMSKGKAFTAQTLKERVLGKKKVKKTLIDLYQEHNEEILELVGKEYSMGRYYQHRRTMNHLKIFIAKEYQADDLALKKVDLKFISRFEHYLKMSKAGGRNTITKYVTNFKKIIHIAFAHNWINKDPFYHWKPVWETVEREVLNEREINVLLDKELENEKLNQVKDVFLFCCFTGLSYSDVKKLSNDHIVLGINGQKWIKTNRKKTNTISSIPLLPTALEILKKYEGFSLNSDRDLLLPVISNQKMNQYLKEIGILYGIRKKMTCHLSRHTFATTVTLTNGVPIESVSRMLGHRSLRTTQIYAKVVDKKLMEDMMKVRHKFKVRQLGQ